MKDCPNRRGHEKGKEIVQPNGPSDEAPRRQRFYALKTIDVEEDTSADVSGALL